MRVTCGVFHEPNHLHTNNRPTPQQQADKWHKMVASWGMQSVLSYLNSLLFILSYRKLFPFRQQIEYLGHVNFKIGNANNLLFLLVHNVKQFMNGAFINRIHGKSFAGPGLRKRRMNNDTAA